MNVIINNLITLLTFRKKSNIFVQLKFVHHRGLNCLPYVQMHTGVIVIYKKKNPNSSFLSNIVLNHNMKIY